ncbi:MAG: TRAP transporter small permease [Deltaproteobacteria bacterium]|nr:TRAP transporter small permease [Deltaproteobacteria bacterium]
MGSKKTTSKIILIFDNITQGLAYFSGILLALITFAIFAEVIVRKLWSYSIIGVVECSEYALVFITFLSASWILKQDAHVKVDLVLGWLKPESRALLNMITSIFGAILCMFIAYKSALIIWDLWQRNLNTVKALELPMAPLHISIFVGCFMLALGFIRRAHGYLIERKSVKGTK